jgi:hypothetical protein
MATGKVGIVEREHYVHVHGHALIAMQAHRKAADENIVDIGLG